MKSNNLTKKELKDLSEHRERIDKSIENCIFFIGGGGFAIYLIMSILELL